MPVQPRQVESACGSWPHGRIDTGLLVAVLLPVELSASDPIAKSKPVLRYLACYLNILDATTPRVVERAETISSFLTVISI